MKRINKYVALSLLSLCFLLNNVACLADSVATLEKNTTVVAQVEKVAPLAVVNNPQFYLDKTITMEAKFDKFSTLGLDYPPAMRANTDYISFMIFRDDTSFDIPLSEMKLFLKRDVAQEFVELKSKEKVVITGKVFSTALGDPWIDVTELKIVK